MPRRRFGLRERDSKDLWRRRAREVLKVAVSAERGWLPSEAAGEGVSERGVWFGAGRREEG